MWHALYGLFVSLKRIIDRIDSVYYFYLVDCLVVFEKCICNIFINYRLLLVLVGFAMLLL